MPLPRMTPEALGVKQLPPVAMTMNSNRAWSYKPGLLLALAQLAKSITASSRLSQDLGLKLKLVTSSLNHCLY